MESYSPYYVPFNPHPLHTKRKLRMICIGAGLAGLTLTYKIVHEHKLEDDIDLTIYERQKDVGGTWLTNRYPGLTCDVPVHVYTLPWSPKHDWTKFMAGGPEIWNYIKETNEKYGLDKYIKFESMVKEAVFDEVEGKWNLTVEHDGHLIKDQCDILVGAAGTQNTPLEPKIPGLQSFKGQITHTGKWDETLDCENKRIAVIGNGSSGIQTFGALQEKASKITHYIRSPTWISLNFLSQFTRDGESNFEYTEEDIQSLKDPEELLAYRRKLESTSNGIFKNLVFDETCQDVKANFRATMERVMKERLSESPELHKRLIPSYQPWCRRLTPGDAYLSALQASNADLVDTPIETVTETGIRTKDGNFQEYDIIVTATGFVNSRVVPWQMKGRGGITLAERWKINPDGYISVCAADMPNYFTLACGPNFTIANGSVLSAMGFVSDYILKWATKIASEDIKSVCVKNSVIEAYNIYLQQILHRTAWNRDCDSWYKKGQRDEYRTGITAIYPGSMMHFKDMLSSIRGEDFDIIYRSRNPFNFLGNGLTNLDLTDGANLAYYLDQTMRLDSII